MEWKHFSRRLAVCIGALLIGCGDGSDALEADGGLMQSDDGEGEDAGDAEKLALLPYAQNVVVFTAGANAGFGQGKLPDVVLGPPKGRGLGSGSTDVLSLGVGGSIVLDFGDKRITDGPGPDFIVFENAFYVGGDINNEHFVEPAQVSVSDDGQTWFDFPCDIEATDPLYQGCAGLTPTLQYDPFSVIPLDVAVTGGDAFDLSTLGQSSARYVKLVDRSPGTAPTGGNNEGFDLDAVGLIHVAE